MHHYKCLTRTTAGIVLFSHLLMSCWNPKAVIKPLSNPQQEVCPQPLDTKTVFTSETKQRIPESSANEVEARQTINKVQPDQLAISTVTLNSSQSASPTNQPTTISSVTTTSRSTYNPPVTNKTTKPNRKGIGSTNQPVKFQKELQTRQFAASTNRCTEDVNASPNTNTPVSSELMNTITGKIYTIQEGYTVTFDWEGSQCMAHIEEISSGGIRKNRLPVYLLPGMAWEQLANMNKAEQPYRFKEICGGNGQKGHVLVGKIGLMGGEKTPLHEVIEQGDTKQI